MNGKVYCNGTRVKCLQQMELTVGMVGAEVEFDFSEEWDGLGKLAVFRSDGSRDVIVDENGVAVVPHEILTTPGMDVEVGVYAVREDGTTWPAPTPFCKLTRNGIAEGADPSGDESYPPTPDVGEQAVAAASKALEAAAEAQEVAADIQRRADAGEFDGAQGEKGEKGDPGEKGDKGDKGDPGTGVVELDTTLTQSGKAADAKAVGDALDELEAKIGEDGSGGSAEIPFFNLDEMGLGAVTVGGSWASLTTDTSEIRAALAKGLVKFGLKYNYEGAYLYVEMTGGVLYADELGESYQVVQNGVLGDDSIMLSVMVQPDGIGAVANKLMSSNDGGAAIVDVSALPTEDINEDVLYRLTTGMVVFNGQNGRVFDDTAVYIVDSLPETGEPCSSDIGESTAIYYNTSKGAAYGYIDERASVSLMQPVGWKSASTAFAAMGYQYSGVVTSMNDVARSSAAVLLEHNLYHYKNGWERVAGDTPFFDLSNLGLEAVDLAGVADGVSVRVGADTRAIINALARGAVKFGFQIIYNGAALDVEAVGSAMYLEAENTYQIHNFSVFADMPMTVTISVDKLYVSVSVAAASSGGGAKVYVQPDEPTGAVVGTLWYDTDEPSVSNAEGVSF